MNRIKRSLRVLIAAGTVATAGFFGTGIMMTPLVAQAAGCTSGTLVKGTPAAVYYCGSDGSRYVFPNQQTYNTWYSGFSDVKTMSDAEIAAIPLGGNVTYKPGVRLIKIQSIPKVYAVTQGGVLHWIANETAAKALYGSDWNQKVDDLPDWAWVDYGVGSNISSASDYSPSSAASGAQIGQNVFTHSSASSSSSSAASQATVTLSLSPYSSSLSSGQSTTATVNAYDPAGISSVRIFANGSVVQTCNGGGATGIQCTANIYAANYSGSSSISIYGQETNTNGATANSTSSSLLVSSSAGTVTVSLSPSSSTLAQGQSATITAYASDLSAGLTSIYVYANGSLVQTCNNLNGVSSTTCAATIYGSNYSVGSSVPIYATEINRNGASVSSSTTSLSVVSQGSSQGNGGASVTLSLAPYSSNLPSGQSTTVTATAYDPASLATVYIYANGSIVQTCSVSAGVTSYPCSANLYASNFTAGSNIAVYAQANNRNGQTTVSSTTNLAVGNTSSGTGSVTISLSPYSTSLPASGSTSVVATATDNTSGLSAIRIYVNGSLNKTCSNLNGTASSTCSTTIYGSSFANGSSVSVYATEVSMNGLSASSNTANLSVGNAAASGTATLSASLSPYSSSLPRNQTTRATFFVDDTYGISSINIYVNGSVYQACTGLGGVTSASCGATINGANYASGTVVSIYAQETNRSGGNSTSSTYSLTVN